MLLPGEDARLRNQYIIFGALRRLARPRPRRDQSLDDLVVLEADPHLLEQVQPSLVDPARRLRFHCGILAKVAATGSLALTCDIDSRKPTKRCVSAAWGRPQHERRVMIRVGAAHLLSGRNLWTRILAHGFIDTFGVIAVFFGWAS